MGRPIKERGKFMTHLTTPVARSANNGGFRPMRKLTRTILRALSPLWLPVYLLIFMVGAWHERHPSVTWINPTPGKETKCELVTM